jgi:predicted transcriptional regulator YheO
MDIKNLKKSLANAGKNLTGNDIVKVAASLGISQITVYRYIKGEVRVLDRGQKILAAIINHTNWVN